MGKVKMEKLQATKMTNQALKLVKEIVGRYKGRLSGSVECLNAAEDLAVEFEKVTDKVKREKFTLSEQAFLAWIKILVVIYPIALLLSFLSLPITALILLLAGLFIMVGQFFLYKEIIDRFFPKVDALNVFGIIEPQKEVLNTVVFSGHHDSARVFNFFVDKPHLYIFKVGGALAAYGSLTLLTLVQIFVKLFNQNYSVKPFLLFQIILTVAIYLMAKLWFFASNEATPGAGDNLIASAMAIEVARYFKNREKPLEHTRLIVASFDGEEAGLRGARHFYKNNKELFEGSLYNFNVDCPYFAKDLFFLTSDINGSVKLSQQMATQCVDIAKGMGYEAFSQPIAFLTGGTDAAEAAKAGFEAVSLMAMPWDNKSRANVYHTPNDLPEAIEAEAVKRSLSIAIRFIEQVDDTHPKGV